MHTVVTRGQVYQPTVSGDGKVIAWRDLPQRGRSAIAVKREDEDVVLLGSDRAVANPSLNQDGSVIIWEQHAGKNTHDWDLARLEWGQSEPTIIIDSDGRDIDADLSHDGNTVVVGHISPDVRTRTVEMWNKDQGRRQVNPEGQPSALPQISGDGQRVFYLKLPDRANVPNQIWMQEADGSEKPVVYELGQDPPPVQKHTFDTNDTGSILAWIQKEGSARAQVWRRDLANGTKEKLDEPPMASQVTVSGDGSTVAWISTERSRSGRTTSRLHWKSGSDQKLIAQDDVGLNTHPSLSDDGKTLVWAWKNPRTNLDHEIRKVDFSAPGDQT